MGLAILKVQMKLLTSISHILKIMRNYENWAT